jgi:hypothetical protein
MGPAPASGGFQRPRIEPSGSSIKLLIERPQAKLRPLAAHRYSNAPGGLKYIECEEIRHCLDHLERAAAIEHEQAENGGDERI